MLADEFDIAGRTVFLRAGGEVVACFHDFQSIIVDQSPADASAAMALAPGEAVMFAPVPSVSIAAINITISGGASPASAGEAIQALFNSRSESPGMS